MMESSRLMPFLCQKSFSNDSIMVTPGPNTDTEVLCNSKSQSFDIRSQQPKVPWWFCDEDLVSAGISGCENHPEDHRYYDKFAPIGVFQKSVRIGPEFQVQVSPFKSSTDTASDCNLLDQSVWIPPPEGVLSNAKLSSFLKECEALRLGPDSPPIFRHPSSAFDNDDALSLLFSVGYDVDRAMAKYFAVIQLKN